MNQTKPIFGDVAKTTAFGELILSETIYAPFAELPEHAHDFAYFCFVLGGSYTEKLSGKEFVCRPSALVFHRPHASHADFFHKSGGVCFNVRTGDALRRRVAEFLTIPDESVFFNEYALKLLAERAYREFLRPDDFSALALEGIVLEIYAEISRAVFRKDSANWLSRAEELLRAKFLENLSLSDVAAEVGRHPVHLAREFRRRFGCTIGEYVRRLRVEYAAAELSKPHASISEIAHSAGFAQQSHFTKTFKALTGKTPREYRANLRSKR